jgi:hypothetical protein
MRAGDSGSEREGVEGMMRVLEASGERSRRWGGRRGARASIEGETVRSLHADDPERDFLSVAWAGVLDGLAGAGSRAKLEGEKEGSGRPKRDGCGPGEG